MVAPTVLNGAVLNCSAHSPFIPTLAAAVLDGSIWNRGAPEPHELPKLTIYLPTQNAVEPLKLAFLEAAPNGATFLPRIRVLGGSDPLEMFAAYGPAIVPAAALDLLEQALALPPAFDGLERQMQLAALIVQASHRLTGAGDMDEPLFTGIPAASAFTVAGQIASLIGEAHAQGADLARAAALDSSRASGHQQLSLQLLRAVLRGWQAHKARAGKLDREEHRNRLMAIEAEFIRQSDAPVIIAGSTGSVAATVGLMEAALSRPASAVVLYGLDIENWVDVKDFPEHPQHGLHQLLARLNVRAEGVRRLTPHPYPSPARGEGNGALSTRESAIQASLLPSREKDRMRGEYTHDACIKRSAFLSHTLRPAPATTAWAALIEQLKQDTADPLPGLSLIEAETVQDEAAAIALILRESLETPGQTAALVTPSESLLGRVRHVLAQWGLGAGPAAAHSADIFAARVTSCAASGKPEDFAGLLRHAADARFVRVAEIVDVGVLRQMWRPSALDGIPAALSRAQHAIASGEARHPAMRRIDAAEWEAARALAAEVIEALSPLTGLSDGATGGVTNNGHNPSPCPSPAPARLGELATWECPHPLADAAARLGEPATLKCPHPQADADGRGDACTTVATSSPLPEGEGQGEGSELRSMRDPRSGETRRSLQAWLTAHREVLSRLAALGIGAAAENCVLDSLERASGASFSLALEDYAALFEQAALARRNNAVESPHPRLLLRKPLDARLLIADVVVLGGLNEGSWPQASGPDPWLSRKDRAFVGLPPSERRVGQAAYDFTLLAAATPRAILTRAKKENGSLTRPSRWIARIKALVSGAGKAHALKPDQPWLTWVAAQRAPKELVPAFRPAPRPPLAARPRRLSVTAIETWFANPYAIYARQILGLEPLRRLDRTSDARDKGILYHAALHGFFQAYPKTLPDNAAAELLRELDKAAGELGFNLENAPFWRPRFARFAQWFAETEGERRAGVSLLKSEVGGKLRLDAPAGTFEITARADRIDRLGDGCLRIYDFKTSANTAKVSARRGAPQLALEGLLAKEGAFAGIPAGAAAELFYIVATGGEPPGEIVTLKGPCAEAIEAARAGTLQRIARFDDEATAYAYETRAIFGDKAENDPYAHLARAAEWSVEAEDSEGGDD